MAVFGLLSLQVLVPRQFACICHSINMEWSVKENHVAVNALHNCRKSHSQIFRLRNHWKFCECASIRQLNIIRNSGGLKTGLSQDAWNVWGLKPLSKQYVSAFTEIHSGNRRSCPESWTYRPNQVVPYEGQSTHESAPHLKGTPPYFCFEGDPMDKSRMSPPMARQERAQKHPLHGRENLHHQGAV